MQAAAAKAAEAEALAALTAAIRAAPDEPQRYYARCAISP